MFFLTCIYCSTTTSRTKLVGHIRRFSVNFPQNALLMIYKSFIRPHIDYGDIFYDKANNENFQNKVEKVQYRVCLGITGTIQRTTKNLWWVSNTRQLLDDGTVNFPSAKKWIAYYQIIFNHIWISILKKTIPSDQHNHLNSDHFHQEPNLLKIHFSLLHKWSILNNLKADIRNAKSVNFLKNLTISEKKGKSFIFSIWPTQFKTTYISKTWI